MDKLKIDEEGKPILDENGNFIYEPYIFPNWNRFKFLLSIKESWITYTNTNPYMSSILTMLILQEPVEVDKLQRMMDYAFYISAPSEISRTEWDEVAKLCHIPLKIIP